MSPSKTVQTLPSGGKHRREHHKGWHRKPGRTRQYAAYAGTTAAAGVIAAGLAAGPAGATETGAQTVTVSTVEHMTAAHLAYLHYHHLRHLEHLAREHEMRQRDTWTTTQATTEVVSAGVLSPSQIGALWLAAGGSPAAEGTAECIAHFESGGRITALSPTDDFGVWQINGSHGPAMATFDPMGNARAAIAISDDGTNWSAWTTAGDCGV
jgi:hypothetical protein